MAQEYSSGFCPICEKQKKIQRPRINHVLHLLLSLCTLGIWIFVWILLSIRIGEWRCSTCGTRVKRTSEIILMKSLIILLAILLIILALIPSPQKDRTLFNVLDDVKKEKILYDK